MSLGLGQYGLDDEMILEIVEKGAPRGLRDLRLNNMVSITAETATRLAGWLVGLEELSFNLVGSHVWPDVSGANRLSFPQGDTANWISSDPFGLAILAKSACAFSISSTSASP